MIGLSTLKDQILSSDLRPTPLHYLTPAFDCFIRNSSVFVKLDRHGHCQGAQTLGAWHAVAQPDHDLVTPIRDRLRQPSSEIAHAFATSWGASLGNVIYSRSLF